MKEKRQHLLPQGNQRNFLQKLDELMIFCFGSQSLETNTHRTGPTDTAHIFIYKCIIIVILNFHFILFWVKWNSNTWKQTTELLWIVHSGVITLQTYQTWVTALYILYFTLQIIETLPSHLSWMMFTIKSKPQLSRHFPHKSFKINKMYEWIMLIA